MRMQLNQPISRPKYVTPRKQVEKSDKRIKKKVSPPMDEAEIRTKIAKQEKAKADPKAMKAIQDQGKLKNVLKNSNFQFSAKERKVFAKILGK